MKILVVTSKYYPDTFPINLICESLVKKGHEVDVLTVVPFKDGNYIKEYDKPKSLENGVTVIRVKVKIREKGKRSIIRHYLSIYSNFKKWANKNEKQYDVIYSYSISPVVSLVAGNIVSKKKGAPHVAHVLDIWPESVVATKYTRKGSLLYLFLYHWSKKLYRGTSKILIGSRAFQNYFEEELKIKNKELTYLVQPGLVYQDNDNKNPYDTKKTNLLYAGNISKLQLVDYIIPAMKKINDDNIVFNVIGDGSYLDEFNKALKESNINNVIYHGYYSYQESAKFFNNADAIFVPLKNEGIVGKTIPNKLISSLYYSKVIIGMVSGESKEMLERNGNIIAEESIDGLVNAINQFLSLDIEERQNIGNKNRQLYDDNYSIDIFLKKLLSSFPSK